MSPDIAITFAMDEIFFVRMISFQRTGKSSEKENGVLWAKVRSASEVSNTEYSVLALFDS